MTKFGEKVTARLNELNMDQKTLAISAGIPASSLSRYISTTEPRIDTVLRIAKALGVEPSYFTENVKEAMTPYDEVVSVVGRSKKALTPEEKAKIIALLFSED